MLKAKTKIAGRTFIGVASWRENIEKEKNKVKLRLLSLAVFLMGFQMAMAGYVTSTFLQEVLQTDKIEIFYLFAYGASLYLLFQIHHLVRRYGKRKMLVLFLMIKVICSFLIFVWADFQAAAIFVIWSLMSGAVAWTILDVLVEKYSSDRVTGAIRGLNLTMMDMGILLAPFLAAVVVENFGFRWVFLVSGVATLLIVLLIWGFLGIQKDKKNNHFSKAGVGRIFQEIRKRKDLAKVYYVALLLDIFYVAMTIYIPLYLLEKGFSWIEIGKITMVALTTFVIFQYPLGILADKKTGEKEWLLVGIILSSVFIFSIAFMPKGDLIFWMIALFLARTGAAIIQVMRDSYFYKQVDSEDLILIDLFRTTKSLAYIISVIIFGVFLLFFPLSSVFIVLSILLLTGLIPLWSLKDTK